MSSPYLQKIIQNSEMEKEHIEIDSVYGKRSA